MIYVYFQIQDFPYGFMHSLNLEQILRTIDRHIDGARRPSPPQLEIMEALFI